MTPQQLYIQLLTRPAAILPYYQLAIAGGPTDGWTQFNFSARIGTTNPRPGRILGTWSMHQAQAFRISQTDHWGHPDVFTAYNIRMQTPGNYNVAALAGFRLPNAGPPALMFTGQLTGCTFCCLRVAGGVLVAHIQPTGGGAFNLQTNVENNGRFAGHLTSPLDGIYGKGNYNQALGLSAASVLGRRAGGTWEIFGQEYNNYSKAVLNVTQIL
jgi:hypothetical protein